MQPTTNNNLNAALEVIDRNTHAGIKRRIPGHAERIEAARTDHAPGYSLAGFSRIAILSSLAMLMIALTLYSGAVYFGEDLSRGGHSPSTEKLEIVIANQVLNVSANTVRFPVQRKAGLQRRLDMYLHWPSLSGYSDALAADFNNESDQANLVFLTIEPRTMSFDMSGRLEPIYSVFFEGLAIKDESGLVRQPLSESGGYMNEDIYYQPDSPYPFVTRCIRESVEVASPFCLRDIHVGRDLMVTYRFHKRFLGQWIELDDAVRNYASALVVNPDLALSSK